MQSYTTRQRALIWNALSDKASNIRGAVDAIDREAEAAGGHSLFSGTIRRELLADADEIDRLALDFE